MAVAAHVFGALVGNHVAANNPPACLELKMTRNYAELAKLTGVVIAECFGLLDIDDRLFPATLWDWEKDGTDEGPVGKVAVPPTDTEDSPETESQS